MEFTESGTSIIYYTQSPLVRVPAQVEFFQILHQTNGGFDHHERVETGIKPVLTRNASYPNRIFNCGFGEPTSTARVG